jgi:hypothetical protein
MSRRNRCPSMEEVTANIDEVAVFSKGCGERHPITAVLYRSGLRNFLMHLALTGIFRAHWSAEVHEEWIRNLLKNRPDLTPDKLDRTRQ